MVEPQTIYDDQGNPMFAIIPWRTFEQMSSIISGVCLSDEQIYDIAKRSDEESFPIDVADRLLSGESPVKVYRVYRGITQKQLARRVGVSAAYVSQIETGKRAGSVETYARIARMLDVDVDDLI